MEELQDAIEDAQYVNAIATQDDGPRPVLPWDKPTADQLQVWEDSKQPGVHTLDWTLSSPIGMFLFSSFIKSNYDDYVRINFCEEVLRFKAIRGKARVEHAEFLLRNYLSLPEATPPKSEIVEYDLERKIPNERTKEEVLKLCELNMDYPNCSESLVGVKGPVLAEILDQFSRVQALAKLTPKYSSMRMPQNHNSTVVLDESVRSSLDDDPNTSESGYWDHSQQSTMDGPLEASELLAHSTDQPASSSKATTDSSTTAMASITTTVASATAAAASESAVPQQQQQQQPPSQPQSQPLTSGSSHSIGSSTTNSYGYNRRATFDVTYEAASLPEFRPMPRASDRASSSGSQPSQREALRWLRSQSMSHSQAQYVAGSVFDDAERVVMESLRRDYWQPFLESDHYTKLKHFLWYQDRPVVPDDFFVMRVLGRGGFGLVNGT